MAMKRLADYHAVLAVAQSMEVRREEYLDHITFQANRRPLFTEIFGPLLGLKEEWAAQGASPGELDLSAYRFRRHRNFGVPVNMGWANPYPERILEQSDDHVLAMDHYGRRVRLSVRAATLALPETYPVATMEDWLRVKPHYQGMAGRISDSVAEDVTRALDEGLVVTVRMAGGYNEPRELMGEEALALACYDCPELVHDILRTIGDTAVAVLRSLPPAVHLDQLIVHEDMAGKGGPLLGPKQVRQFIAPYYRRVWEAAQERGARVFGQDSDGDVRPVIDEFLAAGLNLMYPAEPAAGMDIVRLREQYGTRLAFMGGIDKHVLRRGREEIERELERVIPPMVRTGGCVLGLDHRIPNGTPLEAYRYYIAKAWEIMEREAAAL